MQSHGLGFRVIKTQEKPRNNKGALFGLKDFVREPEP